MATYTAKRADLEAAAADLFDVVQNGAVKIQVNQTFPLQRRRARRTGRWRPARPPAAPCCCPEGLQGAALA